MFEESHEDFFKFIPKLWKKRVAQNLFGQVWGKSGKNLLRPQNFACTHEWNYNIPYNSGLHLA